MSSTTTPTDNRPRRDPGDGAAKTTSVWRIVFRVRWLRYLAAAVVFAIACGCLSAWQFARRDEALDAMAKVENNYDGAPVALDDVLASLDAYRDSDEWKQVSMSGKYLPDEQLLARNRPLNGNPGFEVLTPLLLDDGTVFVVDRGWLPIGSKQDLPDSIPAPPAGEVTVVAHLQKNEPTLPGRSDSTGQVATIHLETFATRLDLPTYTGAYGLLASEDPAPATTPQLSARPELDEGSHLSYAFQWIMFAVIAFTGLGFAIRQEYRYLNSDDPEEQERERQRQLKRARKAKTDAEIEDALLEQ